MDFISQIQTNLHPSFSGLRGGAGLAWLDAALNRIDAAGLNLLLNSFISGMDDQGKASGFLLEVQTAEAVMNAYPTERVTCERRDGKAKSPCDITIETDSFRADFQCKSILNYTNELFLDQFIQWVEATYPDVEPGALLEIQADTSADKETFDELKSWFQVNLPGLGEEPATFVDSRQQGAVRLSLGRVDDAGIRLGIAMGAVDAFDYAQEEDEELVRKKVYTRISESYKTFGFAASDRQFNFVVIDVPSLAGDADEDGLFTALYGHEDGQLQSDGVWRSVFVPSGLFYTKKVTFCSGVIWCRTSFDGRHECIVFANPEHVQAVQEFWVGKGDFRIARFGEAA